MFLLSLFFFLPFLFSSFSFFLHLPLFLLCFPSFFFVFSQFFFEKRCVDYIFIETEKDLLRAIEANGFFFTFTLPSFLILPSFFLVFSQFFFEKGVGYIFIEFETEKDLLRAILFFLFVSSHFTLSSLVLFFPLFFFFLNFPDV